MLNIPGCCFIVGFDQVDWTDCGRKVLCRERTPCVNN